MAATRSGIPISWTSEQIIDRDRVEIRFHHLKAFTKGMQRSLDISGNASRRAGRNHARPGVSDAALAPIADQIIGDFFIHHVASKTLRCMKTYVEANTNKVTA